MLRPQDVHGLGAVRRGSVRTTGLDEPLPDRDGVPGVHVDLVGELTGEADPGQSDRHSPRLVSRHVMNGNAALDTSTPGKTAPMTVRERDRDGSNSELIVHSAAPTVRFCSMMVDPQLCPRRSNAMTRPQEQFAELAHRTQENFKHLWEQWNKRSTELMKGAGRSPSTAATAGNPEEVLDAVFDFAENLIAQQRAFAKQMLRAASQAQQAATDLDERTGGSPISTVPSTPEVPAAAEGTPGGFPSGDTGSESRRS
jgi:hypothetical protein